MNKNKGFIGIGLIIAIVLGAIIIGGGAYYLGKGSNKLEVKTPENVLPNVENQNSPVVDSQQTNITNPTNPVVSTDCTSNSKPSIKVISPNGGETYTAGQQVTVKWRSCNNPYNPKQVIVSLDDPAGFRYYLSGNHLDNVGTADTGILTTTLPNVGYVSTNSGSPINFKPGNNFTVMVSAWPQEYEPIWDFSDNSFTINSATVSASQKCIDTATSLLPAYILKQGDYLDFKLNKITFFALKSDASGAQYFTGNPTNDACMVNVNYSVKLKAGAVNAGNGHESSDGWIVNKSGYATIDKNSSGYYVVSMGTGY